jgi:hypothetical protein
MAEETKHDAVAKTAESVIGLNIAVMSFDTKQPDAKIDDIKRLYDDTLERIRRKIAAACVQWKEWKQTEHNMVEPGRTAKSEVQVQLHMIASGSPWFGHIPVALFLEVLRFLNFELNAADSQRFAHVERPCLTVYLPSDVISEDTWQLDTAQWVEGERCVFTDKARIANIRRLNGAMEDFRAATGIYAVADIVQAQRYGAIIEVQPDPLMHRMHAGLADYCLCIGSRGEIVDHWMTQMPPLEKDENVSVLQGAV